MKDLLATLWEHLKATSAQTRLVICAGVVLMLGVAGVMAYRSSHPHMVPAFPQLDNSQFSSVMSALANAGIRFDTTYPPGPFTVFVPREDLYAARMAAASTLALDIGPKGIQTKSGASSIFDPSSKREQENQKRDWQDLELLIEALDFIELAWVRTSGPPPSALYRNPPPTVSVVVHLRGGIAPDPNQRRALASTVRNGANVPEENITITDQRGELLFDGGADQALDEYLRFEEEWAAVQTTRAQGQLDTMFGPGLTSVFVTGVHDFVQEESVSEEVDPTGTTVSKVTSKSTTPIESAGGPAGLQNQLQGTTPGPAPAKIPEATENETSERYTFGRTTTHKVAGSPVLMRMTVSLAIHESLKDRLVDATNLVKGAVLFEEDRDTFFEAALPLAGVEVDKDGKPVLPEAQPVPEPPNRMMTLLIERGVEILAAAAFLFVLARSLKKSKAKPAPRGTGAESSSRSGGFEIPEEELDLDMLARKHVEQMLEEDPEKVAALLSRWALGDNFYAGVKS